MRIKPKRTTLANLQDAFTTCTECGALITRDKHDDHHRTHYDMAVAQHDINMLEAGARAINNELIKQQGDILRLRRQTDLLQEQVTMLTGLVQRLVIDQSPTIDDLLGLGD